MPSYNKSVSSDPKKTDSSYPFDPDSQDSSTRPGKRKSKNAAKQHLPTSTLDNADTLRSEDQMAHANPTILDQLHHTFPQNKQNNPSQDALTDLGSTQKVSDEATPPIDVWGRGHGYGRSPPVDPIPGLNIGGSPTVEPGFSTRGSFNPRSPPVSPPLRKARPVSYGSAIPPLPSHPRMSTSPYGYSTGAYGSPPVPPHLPQQHFYAAKDIDLGLPPAVAHLRLQDPVALRLCPIPGGRPESRDAALLAYDGGLRVLAYNGERLEQIGALDGIQGTVVDATFLTWNSGHDAFADFRPLIAVTVHGVTDAERASSTPQDRGYTGTNGGFHETRVVVYSLSRGQQIVELLRVPSPTTTYPGGQSTPSGPAHLRVDASGNFVTITSGASGELYVFTVRKGKESAVFECLGKYWTTIQPELQRRDSSHGRSSDADVSPADLGRGPETNDLPIVSLNGRWLAYCPASTPSRPSVNAILGDFVVHNKNSHITAGTAPSRPPVNCDVESPDVDTFLSKVAKGFAQEAVRSAKWISDKGMQTWQNYWKKDMSSPGLPSSNSSSPPVYSPQLGLLQFPPTHATDSQHTARDPEIVTILDLKLLQEMQGRKGLETSPMTTFHPPGGCGFLSFMPTGLGLMTANRKGDVQYIWDLMQTKYVKLPHASVVGLGESVRVRQVARYERLSPSTIVDVVWDGPTGHRFALLTKNKTVHIFDLPKAAFQLPPPRVKKHRPVSVPVDTSHAKLDPDPAPTGGFLASAMSIAGRTQPMLANLRGRAPSMGGGISGIGASGIGLASTTGIKGGRAVAAGLSKSLGAASETVTSIRHANQSRLHMKTSPRHGILVWQRRDGRAVLSVFDSNNIKSYYVRMTKPRENSQKDTVSVFDARKAVAVKIPKVGDLIAELLSPQHPYANSHENNDDSNDENPLFGIWKPRSNKDPGQRMPHPLASAEIDTNTPYQPFSSDRRVTVSVLAAGRQHMIEPLLSIDRTSSQSRVGDHTSALDDKWVFGTEISIERSSVQGPYRSNDGSESVIYRETKIEVVGTSGDDHVQIADENVSHIVSSTKKKKKKGKSQVTIADEGDHIDADLELFQQDDLHGPVYDLLEQDDRG